MQRSVPYGTPAHCTLRCSSRRCRLGRRHPGDLLESALLEVQEERSARAAEAVLDHLQDSAASQVDVLLLDREGHHGVDHVLELLRPSHLAGLVHLADDDGVAEVLLAVVGEHAQGTRGRPAVDVGRTVLALVLAVVHALEAVHDEEEGLVLVAALVPDLVALLEQSGDVGLAAGVEAVLQAQTLSDQLDLVEALLSGVEEDDPAVLRDAVRQGEHHRGLTRTRRAREEGDT